MRVVRIFAEIFDWSEQTTDRAQRVGEMATNAVARKAAGPAAVVDAAISVLDAISAYARLRQAQEITLQLEAEGEMLRRLLEELLLQREIKRKVADAEVHASLQEMRHRLAQQAQALRMDADEFGALSRQVKKLGQLIAAQRLRAPPHCQHLLKLEHSYYQLVDIQLRTLMESVGG